MMRVKRFRRLSSLALALAGLLLLASLADVINSRYVVLKTARLSGGDNATRSAAASLLEEYRGASLLRLDLAALKRRLENITGVNRAYVRRAPPSSLYVALERHRPLARWDGGGLVDVYGERYVGGGGGDLPIFKGAAGAARNITEFYSDATGIIGARIAQLELSPSGDWTLFLRDGLILHLGRDFPRRKLRLYARHAKTLRQRFPALSGVDLRNERGFTVIGGEGKEAKDEKQS